MQKDIINKWQRKHAHKVIDEHKRIQPKKSDLVLDVISDTAEDFQYGRVRYESYLDSLSCPANRTS